MQSSKSSWLYCGLSPLTVVLCYKKISLGQMSMKRVQRQATDWHKIFTVDMSDERLYTVKSVQKMQSRKKKNN